MDWDKVVKNLEAQTEYYVLQRDKSLTTYQKQRFENLADFTSILASALRSGIKQ